MVRCSSIQRAMQYGGDLAAFFHESREFFGDYGLHAIRKCAVRIVMDFDEQAIGADGDCCS